MQHAEKLSDNGPPTAVRGTCAPVGSATVRSLLSWTSSVAVLLLAGCLFGGRVELQSRSAVIRVEDAANRGSVVIVDLVVAYDPAFKESVLDTMTVDGWSEFGRGHLATKPAAVKSKHLELAPGDPPHVVDPWFDRDGGVALWMFARYRASEFVAELNGLDRVLIVFTEAGPVVCAASADDARSTLCPSES